MRTFMVFCVVAVVALVGSQAWATTWQMVGFDSVDHGAVSYDAGGGNVVVPGSAFYTGIGADHILGTQVVGGDGIDLEVMGNFAVYAVVNYSDPDGVFAWAATHPNVPFDLEMRMEGLQVLTTSLGTLVDNWRLGDDGPALVTSFAELGEWGYVELAPGVWMDIAVDQVAFPGKAAISVVLDGFQLHDGAVPSFDGVLIAGDLGGPVPGYKVGSGMRINAVPEPITLLGVGLAITGLGRYVRRRRAAGGAA